MTSKTPRLLAERAAGEANIATVAAIATELQDTDPAACELIKDTVLARGIQHRPTTTARRSARTLVAKHHASAARTTAAKTTASQMGVWIDPHPIPGLSTITATVWSEYAAELMDAIEQRATTVQRTQRAGDTQRAAHAILPQAELLGVHRAEAFLELALAQITVHAHVDLLVPTGPDGSGIRSNDPRVSGPNGARTADTCADPALDLDQLTGALAIHPRAGALDGDRVATLLTQVPAMVTITARHFDPTTGQLADTSIVESYRPPPAMRERVVRRDQHCRYPGCHRPARYLDLDHVTAWPHGPTADLNLHGLCRRHHRLKQRHRWHCTMTAGAITTWTTPTGRHYATEPGFLETYWDLHPPAHERPCPA